MLSTLMQHNLNTIEVYRRVYERSVCTWTFKTDELNLDKKKNYKIKVVKWNKCMLEFCGTGLLETWGNMLKGRILISNCW